MNDILPKARPASLRVATVVLWEYLKQMWGDPLYQAAPAITLFVLPLATAAVLMRRQSAVAQTPLIYGCFAAMVVLWWGVTALFYGPFFASAQYLAMGVGAFVLLVAVTIAVTRMRRVSADPAATPVAPASFLRQPGSNIAG